MPRPATTGESATMHPDPIRLLVWVVAPVLVWGALTAAVPVSLLH